MQKTKYPCYYCDQKDVATFPRKIPHGVTGSSSSDRWLLCYKTIQVCSDCKYVWKKASQKHKLWVLEEPKKVAPAPKLSELKKEVPKIELAKKEVRAAEMFKKH